MALEILANTLMDYAFFTGGHAADIGSTYVFVKRDGLDTESNNRMRKNMKEKGVGRALLTDLIGGSLGNILLVGAAYGLDSVFGIQENMINIHHTMCYGLGTLKYLGAANNLAKTYGQSQLADLLSLPVRIYLSISGQKNGHRDL